MNTLAHAPELDDEFALDRRVDAFEDALARDPDADLGAFLPGPDHPGYVATAAELIRVDLDRAWARNRPRRLADYRSRFPAVFGTPSVLREVAFEEYRLRHQAGEPASPAEYRAGYGVDVSAWPSALGGAPSEAGTARVAVGPLATRTPGAWGSVAAPDGPVTNVVDMGAEALTGRLAGPVPLPPVPHDLQPALSVTGPTVEPLPEPGTEFLGFRLVEELGRGAFGRVFLAQQGALAGRVMALKVARDIFDESQTLAQLQHTNIVPIYSFHQVGSLQAVCMPYFGRTTLAQVVKHVSGRPSLPSSGRDLKSTVNLGLASTVEGAGSAPRPSSVSAAPGMVPVSGAAAGSGGVVVQAPTPAVVPDGWARLDKFTYTEAVLWLGCQLADGLAHAHARGILHRDLKPANVLLTDEGRPMLLDFNLAEDTKLRDTAERAAMGGTLPYMAPEQIEAFRSRTGRIDGRADVFALGVILFELLTGRHPYPSRTGAATRVMTAMLADRRRPPPSVRDANPDVSPAADAIVRKCLAPDPADRYQSAAQLREDLDRQLAHQPLRYAPNPSARERVAKWARRHPRLASSGSVAAAAAVLVAVLAGSLAYARERARDLQAGATFVDHRAALQDVQVFIDDRNRSAANPVEGADLLRGVLARYGVPDDGSTDWLAAADVAHLPDAAQARLREDVGEAFYRLAQVATRQADLVADPAQKATWAAQAQQWTAAAGQYGGDSLARVVREQRADLAAAQGDAAGAKALRAEAEQTPPRSARDQYLLGVTFAHRGRHREALPYLRAATQTDPEHFNAWFVRGTVHLALWQNELAALCFGSCTALRKEFAPAWYNRGLAYSRLRFFDQASDDFDQAVRLDPALADAVFERAVARDALGDLRGAEADCGRALAVGFAPVRALAFRADLRQRLGDAAGAARDRAAGLKAAPADELGWVARADLRLPTDPAAALADADEAVKLNPASRLGHRLRAYILAEHLKRPDDAVAALDRVVEAYPDDAEAWAGRGVMLARHSKRDAAIRDAKEALLRDTRAPNLYQVGCIYALTAKAHPEDRREAFHLLWAGLRTGYGLDIVDTDPDLDPLRADPEFVRLVKAAKDEARGKKP